MLLLIHIYLAWSYTFYWQSRNYSSVEPRPNYGVVFTYEGSAGVLQDYWPHTFHLQLPMIPKAMQQNVLHKFFG